MGLDELFELLDCYVEQSSLSTIPNWQPYNPNWEPKIWYSTDKTTGVGEPSKVNCITSQSEDSKICTIANNCTDGKIKYYDGVCFEQSK